MKTLCAIALLVFGTLAAGLAQAPPAHDLQFWKNVAAQDYKPPADAAIPALCEELSSMLASPDPQWRDQTAYETLAVWIYRDHRVDEPTLRALMAEWLNNLKSRIGEDGADTVFRRSFSALMLSVIAARDNAAPFLRQEEFRNLLNGGLEYLAAEKDLRGYVDGKGWAHSAAHTADLLKFLARSRYLSAADQQTILRAIDRKMTSAPQVFIYGEDERFARAVLSLVNRSDFDAAGFHSWLESVKPAFPDPPSQAALFAFQNRKNLLSKLEVVLAQQEKPSPAATAAQAQVRAALANAF